MVRCEKIHLPPGLPCCTLLPAAENSQQKKEWTEFLRFLQIHNKVRMDSFKVHFGCIFYILFFLHNCKGLHNLWMGIPFVFFSLAIPS